jgi:putative acetyltransferase
MIITWCPPDHPDIVALVADQQRELAASEPGDRVRYPLHDEIEFVLGTVEGRPVACGALQHLSPTEAEVKRMYVVPGARGAGRARKLLAAIEARAAARGYRLLMLETGTRLAGAIALYESSGFTRVPAYGQYAGNPHSVCFAKPLTVATGGLDSQGSPTGNWAAMPSRP